MRDGRPKPDLEGAVIGDKAVLNVVGRESVVVRFLHSPPDWKVKAQWWAAGLENRSGVKPWGFDSSAFRQLEAMVGVVPTPDCYPGQVHPCRFDSWRFRQFY